MEKKILFVFAFLLTNLVFSQVEKQQLQLSSKMEDTFNKGYQLLYIKKDSSYYFFNKALEYALSLKDVESQLGILAYLTYTNGYHYDLEDYYYNLSWRETILYSDSLKTKIPDYKSEYNHLLIDKGNYYFKTKDYNKAKAIFIQLKEAYEKIPLIEIDEEGAEILFSVYNFLGTTYKCLGKYDLAEQYYLKNRSMIIQCSALGEKRRDYIINVNQFLSEIYSLQNRFVESNKTFNNAVNTMRKIKKLRIL